MDIIETTGDGPIVQYQFTAPELRERLAVYRDQPERTTIWNTA